MRAALRLRDALVPYIYSAGRAAATTGVSLLRPMYYSHPTQDNAYTHSGQYMFGADILAAPVSEPVSTVDEKAPKDVWFPPTAGGRTWVAWTNGEAAVAAAAVGAAAGGGAAVGGAVFHGRWARDEIPLFVLSGSIVPMRTMASTHTPFVDPVVWATWLPAQGAGPEQEQMNGGGEEGAGGAGSAGAAGAAGQQAALYEDRGDGFEYLSDEFIGEGGGAAAAAATHTETCGSVVSGVVGGPASAVTVASVEALPQCQVSTATKGNDACSAVNITIQPTCGTFAGQGTTRNHLVQVRGAAGGTPTRVTVNGKIVPRMSPPAAMGETAKDQEGWYLAVPRADGAAALTEPAGSVVVSTGRQGIRTRVVVVVEFGQWDVDTK